MALHSAYILAGAYKGGRRDLAVTLAHAVSDTAFESGKLTRDYGQALCVRKLDTVDAGAWGSIDTVDCPRCLVILKRINGQTTARKGSHKMLTKKAAEGVISDLEATLALMQDGEHPASKAITKTGETLKDALGKYVLAFGTVEDSRKTLEKEMSNLDALLGVGGRSRKSGTRSKGACLKCGKPSIGGRVGRFCDDHKDLSKSDKNALKKAAGLKVA